MSAFVIPYNANKRKWTRFRREVRNQKVLFLERGGTAYEVAEQSGFMAALDFYQLHGLYDNDEALHSYVRNKWILAVEVYVYQPENKAYDRMFLYTDSADDEQELLDVGEIQMGRLLLEQDAFQKLQENGFRVVTGKQRTAWSTDCCFSGNGYNRVLLAETGYHEKVFIQPDWSAVEACLAVLDTEEAIRTRIDPAFSIERIDYEDSEVMAEMHPGNTGVFLCENNLRLESFPECYWRLAYQTAYLKHYYADIKETDTQVCEDREEKLILGIDLDSEASYGAYVGPKQDLTYVLNGKLGCDQFPTAYFCTYEGYGDVLNAGVAISSMGLTIQRMMNEVQWGYGGRTIDHTVIALPPYLPNCTEVEKAMNDRKAVNQKECAFDIQVYQEMGAEGFGGKDMIIKAAELAGVYPVTLLRQSEAICYAYEHVYGVETFEEGAPVLVYDWNQTWFSATVLKKTKERFSVCAEEFMASGDAQLNRMLIEDAKRVLCNDGKLAACSVSPDDERWKKDWDDFERQIDRIKNQLARCGKAILIFDLKWLKKTEEYPWERFEPTFASYYEKTQELVKKVMADAGVDRGGFSHVMLAGDWSKYPYVWEHLEQLTGKKVCQMKDPLLVAAFGAVNSVRR
ncbi:MAG: Hsp70 family protein [bacterium]|nr:Hsp70 family protein [bacterium]MDY4100004.1 Hsp70 family protein [Lachnospiraceae bacterium]